MASLYKDSKTKTYYITWYENRKKRHKSTRTKSYQIALKMLKDLEYQLGSGHYTPYDKIPVQEIFTKYLNDLSLRCTQKHISSQKICVNQFIQHEKVYYLNDITADRIDHYLQCRKNKTLTFAKHPKKSQKNELVPLSDVTIKADHTAIKAFLNWCIKRDYLFTNPARKIDPPKLKTKIPEFLDTTEVKKLIDFLTSTDFEKKVPYKKVSIKYIIFIELFSGLRFKNELLQIRKKDIIQDRNEIYVHNTKTGRYKVIPYNPILNKLLQPLLDTLTDEQLLFPVYQFPKRQWQRIQKELNISISPYKLKHTFATHFYMQTHDIRTLQEILGHSDINTTKIYAHTADLHKKQQAANFNYN